jgi:hypothetical protein
MNPWVTLMRSGQFEEAWRLSDRDLHLRRAVDPRTRPRHLQNVWDGSPIDDRRVLVRCYHGLGDTLQFARYLPHVRAVSREVIVWTQRSLIPLLRRSISGVRFLPLHDGTPDVDYDVDLEIMELPHIFRTTVDTIPADVPYLQVPRSDCSRAFRRVGLVWRGGDWDGSRSIPFDLVDRFLTRRTDVSVLPLQPSLSSDEQQGFSTAVSVASIDTLGREIVNCDLVISVDTMAAHLAGALGVPTWTLLKFSADWRWLLDRADSPWYPSMRLYRQPWPGAWTEVLEAVSASLASLPCDAADDVGP